MPREAWVHARPFGWRILLEQTRWGPNSPGRRCVDRKKTKDQGRQDKPSTMVECYPTVCSFSRKLRGTAASCFRRFGAVDQKSILTKHSARQENPLPHRAYLLGLLFTLLLTFLYLLLRLLLVFLQQHQKGVVPSAPTSVRTWAH